jgi:hypothetical protein
MKNLAGVKQEILDHLNKTSMTYSNKLIKGPSTQGNIKISKVMVMGTNDRRPKGYFVRAPSIDSNKEIPFNRLRNRTLAKVNIGNQL